MRLWAHAPGASAPCTRSSNLSIDVSGSAIVTDSMQRMEVGSRAALTVFALSRMVAPDDQREQMMVCVTRDTSGRTPAATHRGCRR